MYKGSDNKLHFVDSAGADSVIPFSSEPIETYIVNSAGSSAGVLIKNDGSTINGSPINGEYFSCVRLSNGYWKFTALKDCEICYISTLYNSTTSTIIESQYVTKGEMISGNYGSQKYDGITVIKVLG